MFGIEASGHLVAETQHPGSHDLQTVILETGVDLADKVLAYCVGLDNGKGALYSHGVLRQLVGMRKQA
jgi:hypothetical protein